MNYHENVSLAIKDVLKEYSDAIDKYGGFNSSHEGWAIIKEELDELWDEIRKDDKYSNNMYNESKQIAAMALCFMIECIHNK